jgi:hypothetical protein
MFLDLSERSAGSASRGYVQVWILVSLTGVLVATSLGLLLTMSDESSSGQRPGLDTEDSNLPSAARYQHRSVPRRRIRAGEGSPWTAQESVARYQTLIKHIRRAQQPVVEEEPEGPPIEVKVTGAAHRKIAREVEESLEAISPQVSKCYQRRLRHKPRLRGKIFFSFTLVPDGEHGSVGKAHIADSKVHDIRLETCVLKVLTAAQFPAAFADGVWAKKERWYHYNFDLQRTDGDLKGGIARRSYNP